MTDLSRIISETVSDQNPVSDFIDVRTEQSPATAENDLGQSGAVLEQNGTPNSKKKKRGRPPKKKKSAQKSFIPELELKDPEQPQAAPLEQGEIDVLALQRKNAATGATALIQTTGMIVAGADGKMSKDEFENMRENFDKYFEVKGISDFPPGISLGLSIGCYYVRTMTTKEATPKIALAWSWIKLKISNFRNKNPKKYRPETEGDNVA